jgi:CO/xanthine dehydrogenase FAD-binding subunit
VDLHTVGTFRLPTGPDDLVLAPGETWLAGGTWLFSEPQVTTTGLVDLLALGWPDWELDAGAADGSATGLTTGLTIGATCSLLDLVTHAERSGLPGLAVARPCVEALVMSSKVSRRATVGGNVCLALPAGGATSLLTGLGSDAVVWGPGGERRVPVASLVTDVRRTSLDPGELVRAFEVPRASLASTTAFRRAALTPMGRSGAVLVGRREPDGGVHVSVTASTHRPHVLDLGPAPTESDVATAVATIERWYDDPHGAPDWRAAQTLRCALEVVEELA